MAGSNLNVGVQIIHGEPQLVKMDDPILTKVSEEFDFQNPPTDPIELAHKLTKFMLEHNGLGLAANQIGLPYRVFVIKSNPVLCCFNPKIVDFGNEMVYLEEGCLSYPGLFLNISRPNSIRARWTMPNGNTDTFTYSGMTARIFQHELGHLNGIRFSDYAKPVALQMAMKKASKLGHKYLQKDFK